jgi:hypothetical protein
MNNLTVPSTPFFPDFSTNRYTKEFLSMFAHEYPQHGGNFISLEDYGKGYTIYVFNLDHQVNKSVMCEPARQTMLKGSFASPLQNSVTIIAYSIVPAKFEVDKPRNVIV